MAKSRDVKPHIFIGKSGSKEKYIYPKSVVDVKKIPEREREQQWANLKSQIALVRESGNKISRESKLHEVESKAGVQVAFDSFPDVHLAVESLADANQGIELLSVKNSENQFIATVFFPTEKLTVFEKKLDAYRNFKVNKNGAPIDNRKLIDAIQTIRTASLETIWTDDISQFPHTSDEVIWWEAWLPVLDDREAILRDFIKLAKEQNIQVADHILKFPERTVLLLNGSAHQLTNSALLLSKIAEIRRPKEAASFFDELDANEQQEWSTDLLARLQPSNSQTPYICILDTGSNIGHPLIAPFISSADQFSADANWTTSDDDGHGTGMSGIAIWGDLTEALSSSDRIHIKHRLESVKLIRNSGDNQGKHYGVITATGIALAEIENPERTRIFSLALSAQEGRDRGRPSAWSSSIDSLASDSLGERKNPRLMIVCAGNTGTDLRALMEYPHHNELQDIHDPAQAWNAISVGASTHKITITEPGTEGFSALAPSGGLSPYSTTSVTWDKTRPIKPEVVFEGGNVGKDKYSCAGFPSLKLLTTHHETTQRHFSTFEATSAATALAAKFAAEIYSHYPHLWPETVRALLIHSAQWTDTMQQQFSYGTTDRQRAQHLVRVVGFGIPSLERALWSTQNSLSLIIEDELQPYEKEKGHQPTTKDMHLHNIPWPKQSLLDLGEETVEMTVTLSYFVEPNPSSRNISGRYSYPSHQLRFDVKRPTESSKQFLQRTTRAAQDDEEGAGNASTDPGWLLGDFRHKGSIHKDCWKGTAAQLAERNQIAIYPATGWWRTRQKLGKANSKGRYSLVITISTPREELDIYSEVAAAVSVKNEVQVEIS